MRKKQFLAELQTQAKLQSSIEQSSLLPHQLDGLNTLIGNYPWQVLLFISGISALLLSLAQVFHS